MNLKEEYQTLQKRLSEIEVIQRKCNHEWGEVVYSPDYISKSRVTSMSLTDDVLEEEKWKEPRDRWYRTCNLCGKTEYSYEQKPTAYIPVFK